MSECVLTNNVCWWQHVKADFQLKLCFYLFILCFRYFVEELVMTPLNTIIRLISLSHQARHYLLQALTGVCVCVKKKEREAIDLHVVSDSKTICLYHPFLFAKTCTPQKKEREQFLDLFL